MELNFKTDFQELEKLRRDFAFLGAPTLARIQGSGLRAAARVASQSAKQLVPVRTGQLRRSIRVGQLTAKIDGKNVPGAGARLNAGGPSAKHAHLIELGTVKAAARPFLEPASKHNQQGQMSKLFEETRRNFLVIVNKIQGGARLSNTDLRLLDF